MEHSLFVLPSIDGKEPDMLPSNIRSNQPVHDMKMQIAFVVLICCALVAFEIFNYSTTDHALTDLLGNLAFAGIQWSTILALAFCGIDFAGIARLFTPEQGSDEPKEVWYLFGAWLLAATMNAVLTWWGVSMAVVNHTMQSTSIIDPTTIATVVPLFVAIMVWIIRILIIGTLSIALDRLLHPGMEHRPVLHGALAQTVGRVRNSNSVPVQQPMNIPSSLNSAGIPARPSVARSAAPRQAAATNPRNNNHSPDYAERPEPTYHSIGARPTPEKTSGSRFNR
jgi:hypothetical protein